MGVDGRLGARLRKSGVSGLETPPGAPRARSDMARTAARDARVELRGDEPAAMNSARDARPRRDATALVSPSRASGAASRSTSRGTVSAEGDMRTNSSRASARSPALTRTMGSMRPLRGDERDGFLRPCARAGRREVQSAPHGARERPSTSWGGYISSRVCTVSSSFLLRVFFLPD